MRILDTGAKVCFNGVMTTTHTIQPIKTALGNAEVEVDETVAQVTFTDGNTCVIDQDSTSTKDHKGVYAVTRLHRVERIEVEQTDHNTVINGEFSTVSIEVRTEGGTWARFVLFGSDLATLADAVANATTSKA